MELRRQSGARARSAHRWRLLLVIGVILLVGLGMVVVAFIAPPFVKRQLEHRLAAALHREVTIRDLQLNPWVLSTTIDGLAINDRDGLLLFGCERLYVRFGFWSLFSGPWNLKEVSLTAPAARLEIDRNGTLNISDLLAPLVENSPALGKPHPIRIGQLAVSQARFTFADHSRAQDFSTELGPLSFSLGNFSTVPVAPGAPYEFTASSESGESWHWRGTLSADPLRSIGEFALGSIALKKYAPYFAGMVRGEVLAGTLDAAGRYEIDLSARPCVIKMGDGELHLHGLQLAPPGAVTPAIDLPEADLTGIEASLAPLKVSAVKLEVAGGSIALQRDASGMFNLARIFAAPAGSPPSPVSPDVALAILEVRGVALTLDDALAPRPAHNAMALDLLAQGISLAPGAPPAPLELAARLSPQGVLALKGFFSLAPCRADLAVELTDFSLADATPYLAPRLNLRITEGMVSARGQLTVAVPADAAPQVLFRGDAEVDRCNTVDGVSGEDFVGFASLGIKQLDFTSAPLALAVGQVSLIEPSLHFTRYRDGSTNLETVPRRATPGNFGAASSPPVFSPDQPSADAYPSSGVSPISIDRVVLANGLLTFTDRSIEPNTSFTVDDLSGLLSGLSSAERTRATIDLRGKVDDSSPVGVAGQVNLFSRDAFADLTAGCSDIDLQPASPYFGKYAGYTLGRGSLSLDVKVQLEQRHLDSQNIVTLNQFTLGERTNSPDATNLPVRFAIALLKDASGKIVLNLPIQGRLDDPALPIGRVVFQAVANILVKATTDPFSLLGSMFGGANQTLDHIDFAPGASELATTEMKKLDVVARALVARPGLNLEVAGDADVDDDTPSLQRQKLKQLLRARIWESRHNEDPGLPPVDQIEISNDELDRALLTLYNQTFAPGPMPGGGRTAVAHAREGPMLFPRNPLYFSNSTTGGASLADAGTRTAMPESAASNLPPAPLSLQDMVARLAVRQRVTDGDLSQLAADRAQHVKDYLVEQDVPAERMLSADSVVGSSTRVTLQLK
jgi:uncharacterized protein involved in outer membrane biogenesis/outer membrane protein OmpA-like peptidoglycan-associated protein